MTEVIFTPADPGWDDPCQAWNLGVDQDPAAVALTGSVPGMNPRAAVHTYLNLAGTRGGPARFCPPQAYDRLRRVKAAVDPDDVIRANHPIPPIGQIR